MNPVLVRVDERLIHGQVSMGWVPVFDIQRILIIDNRLAEDDWERDLVKSSAPDGVTVQVFGVREAGPTLTAPQDTRVMVLARRPETMVELMDHGVHFTEINLGGLHFRDGARRFLDYLFLTPADVSALEELKSRGVQLIAQDLPGHSKVDLNTSLAEGLLEYNRLPVS